MSRGPIPTVGGLADHLEASERAMGWAEDAACLILYRSELAMVLAALRGHDVSMGYGLTLPAAAAPTLPTEPEDLAWEGIDRMTKEKLLAGLEGLVGPLEPKGPVVQPRAPKHYGEGRQGPVGAPQPSASAPGGPSCSPRFGLAGSTPSTKSGSG